jgi:cytoskeletal protein RodZ
MVYRKNLRFDIFIVCGYIRQMENQIEETQETEVVETTEAPASSKTPWIVLSILLILIFITGAGIYLLRVQHYNNQKTVPAVSQENQNTEVLPASDQLTSSPSTIPVTTALSPTTVQPSGTSAVSPTSTPKPSPSVTSGLGLQANPTSTPTAKPLQIAPNQ